MTTKQKDNLNHFILRPEMWIRIPDKDQVVAFIHGVEFGDDSVKLTEILSTILEKRYKIKKTATGWPYQVQRFAKKKKLLWFDAFKLLMLEILDAT